MSSVDAAFPSLLGSRSTDRGCLVSRKRGTASTRGGPMFGRLWFSRRSRSSRRLANDPRRPVQSEGLTVQREAESAEMIHRAAIE